MRKFTKIPGYLQKKEGLLLQKYAREQQNKFKYDLLEIGSWKGRSSMAIASVLKDDHRLWMIDYFRGGTVERSSPPSSSKYSRGKTAWVYPELLRTVIEFGVENRVIIFPMTSQEAASIVKEKFCFIFIDGNHSYDGVSSDWNLWWPHLIVGGICLFHDAHYGPIQKFINKLKTYPGLKEEKRVHTIMAFRKLK